MAKKNIGQLLIVACLFIGVIVRPVIRGNVGPDVNDFIANDGYMSNLIDQIDQEQTDCGGVLGCWNNCSSGECDETELAQDFIPTLDTLTRVELFVTKTGSTSGMLRISIR